MLRTSKPQPAQPYPFLVVAGTPSAGKTYTLLEAARSDLIGRTFVLTLGEERPDAFREIAGDDFEMIDHDGTYDDMLGQIREVKAEPMVDGKPNYLAFDGGTALHTLIRSQSQAIANRRAVTAAARHRSPIPVGDVKLTGDLWDMIRDQWATIIHELRTMPGPTAMSVRLEEKTVSIDGVETAEKVWRMRAGENLQYDATAIIEMSRRGDYVLTKQNTPGSGFMGNRPWPDFTLDAFWRSVGLGTKEFGVRRFETPRLDPSLTTDTTGRDWLTELAGITSGEAADQLLAEARAANAAPDVLESIRARAARTVTIE
jgi:hypothetical protein